MPAYSKTTWIDGSAPAIDATNLNKMEQGIFDAFRQDGSTTMSGQLVTTAGSAATPAIAPTGDSNTGIFFPAADTIAFSEGGLEAMRINSSGNVGIGMDSNGAKLALNGNMSLSSASFSLGYNIESNTGSISGVNSPFYGLNMGVFTGFSAQGVGLHGYYGQIFSTSGTERMRITSGGNVGIGTTSPTAPLEVQSAQGVIKLASTTGTNSTYHKIDNTGGTLTLGIDNSTGSSQFGAGNYAGGLWHSGNYNLTFGTNNSVRMTISGGGNVGIGTTSPTTRLQVDDTYGGYRAGIVIKNTADGATGRGTGIEWHSGTGTTKGEIALTAIDASQNGYDMKFQTTATGDSKTTKMTITGAGNVGIGTTPSTWGSGYTALSIKNAGNSISSSGASQLLLSSNAYDSGAGAWKYNENGYYANLMEIGSNGYLFYTTTSTQGAGNSITWSERMRLNNSGYLLIGYTSSNGAYPLQVNGQIFATSSTIATSDGRYKKDVVSLDGALDIVKALNPVQFSWKDHPVHKFNTDVPTVGFIAQEVEQALADKSYLTSIIKKSECTWETETGEFVEREVTRDVEKQVEREITEEIDGEEVTRTVTETVIEQVTEIVQEPVKETHTEEFLGIAESNLIAILTKAVKELTAKVEALEAQLNK